jgi:protein phosphatase
MIRYHGETDIGRRRSLNEDTIFAGGGLFIVCDGMGGHKAGEVASKMATDAIATFIQRSDEDPDITWPYGFEPRASLDGNRLRTSIKLANRAVFRKSASSDDYTGMGTTVAAVLIARSRPQMTYATVGDSRIYLIRAGAILQLTRDDSWVNMGWEGADTLDSTTRMSMKNVLTKALGPRQDVDFDVVDHELVDRDVLLLCSDGLTNMVTDDEILEVIAGHEGDLERACRQLIVTANAHGGRDNISAVLVQYTT